MKSAAREEEDESEGAVGRSEREGGSEASPIETGLMLRDAIDREGWPPPPPPPTHIFYHVHFVNAAMYKMGIER